MLQNPPVRSKLIAMLALPVLVMVLLVFSRTNQNVNQGREADRLTGLTNFMDKSLDLTSQLQKERDLATGYLASDRRGGRDRLFTQQARVDRVAAEYRAEVAKLDFADYRDRVRKHAVNVDRRLSELAGQRAAMDKPNVAMTRPLDYYTDTIGELLDLEKQVPLEYTERQSFLGNASLELVQNMNNLVRLSRGKEAVASERSLMYALLVHQAVAPDAPTGMSPGQDRDRLTAAVSAGASWLKEFQAFATPEQRGVFARTVTGFGVERSAQLRQAALRLPNRLDLSASPEEWLAANNAKVDRLRGVEQEQTFSLLRSIDAAHKAANTSTITGSGLIMLVLFVSVGISLSMSQSMVQSLKRLKESAQELVERRLPTVVERLKQLERTEEVDLEPEEVPPAVVAGNEIGEVATAFSQVHHVAVQVATEQAALRKSVGDMFLNFARRNQVLIDRQLELIEDLEGRETNQAQREEFLRLDRLATSMRRNAEDLIVLSGATPPRRWSEPVPLPEVMQAALSEVEDYRRVELVRLDELAIVGEAARRRGPHPRRADRERDLVLAAPDDGARRRPDGDHRLRDRGRGPRHRHVQRRAGGDQRAPGQPDGHRPHPAAAPRPVRGRPAGHPPQHQGPAAALLVRGRHRAGPAAQLDGRHGRPRRPAHPGHGRGCRPAAARAAGLVLVGGCGPAAPGAPAGRAAGARPRG